MAPLRILKKLSLAAAAAAAAGSLLSPALAQPRDEAPQAPAPSATIFVLADGVGRAYSVTLGITLGEALAEAGVPLGETDQLSAQRESVVADKQLVRVLRMTFAVEERTVPLPFEKTSSSTPVACESGLESRVVTPGSEGLRREVYSVVTVEGELNSEAKLSEAVEREATPEVSAPCAKPKAQAAAPAARSASSASGSAPSASSVPAAPRAAVSGSKADWMAAAGIPESDWTATDFIISRESSWNPHAVNPSSGACGLVQALPCTKLGSNWSDPVVALTWFKSYCASRYGSIQGAYAFWVTHHWY